MRRWREWLLAVLVIAQPVTAAETPRGVILLYHRVSDEGPASTRVTPTRFAQHLDLIEAGGHTVVPLMTLLSGMYQGTPLPEKPVAITFDDAYRSIADNAFPLLAERGMPLTIFVATDRSDEGAKDFLDWPTLRTLADSSLVSVGAHSLSHAHLEDLAVASGERSREIDGSVARLRAVVPEATIDVFAYPYGEYSRATEAMLRERGLYGLAQQSGAVGPQTPSTRIPRFPLYVGGDSDTRLKTALSSYPLHDSHESDAQVFFTADEMPESIWRFQPLAGDYRRDTLHCFSASGQPLTQRWSNNTLWVELPEFAPGRNKVNCTAAANNGDGYFWYSRLWLIADEAGEWLRY